MVRLWSPNPSEDPPADNSSPDFVDLDFYIPDFDPIQEWLVDPDHAMIAPEEFVPQNPAAPDPEKFEGSIYEKMEKVYIDGGEQNGGLDSRLELKEDFDESVDKNPAFVDPSVGGREVRNGSDDFVEAVKVDGGSDVCSVSDSIMVAGKSEEESSETESEDESSSSDDSSSSSSEEDDKDDLDDDGRSKHREVDDMVDIEEGEIRDLDQEDVVICSDGDEEEEVTRGPIKSKHEIEGLPPVPQVEVFLQSHHQTLSVGAISSILGEKVIVEGSEKHSPLNEGSILWITETRSPLGLVDEIFGPVKNPYYVVRYNSDKELPIGIKVGTLVSVVMEFASHILSDKDLYRKGYDASGDNDEEASDEVEFSDDEKEAEYKRSLRQSKRASNDRRDGNREAAIDKRKINFKGAPVNNRRYGNQESAIDMRGNYNGAPVKHGNQDSAVDKRGNYKGAPARRNMQPPVSGCNSCNCSAGAPNQFVNPTPTMAAVPPAVQLGSCFTDPSQLLLLNQTNNVSSLGLPPQHQQQMGTPGQYQMNVLPSPRVGDNNSYHHQHQNQAFNNFANVIPCQQQFIPNLGTQANVPWLGGPLNLSTVPNGPMGYSSVSQAPSNADGQGASGSCNAPSYCQPSSASFQGGMSPVQFNPFFGPTGMMGSPMQFNPFFVSTPLVGCSNFHGQGVLPSQNALIYGQTPPTMQFNASVGPTHVGPMGLQSSINQAPFGYNNLHDQSTSDSHNSLGGVRPPMQFNPGRSPFRGRSHYQRGGRHSIGRGDRQQNG